jgi:hypothetical protein
LWIREKGIALFCRFKERRRCLVKKKFEARKKIGMPVKWLEAEEIDKSFTSNIRMVESYPNKAAASMLSD